MQNSIHSRKEIKTFWKNFEKMLLVVHLLFLHAKQLLMKLLFESLQTSANLLLRLMPANHIPTRCESIDQNVKLKASLQQADKKKLTASVLMGFFLIVTLCLKPWVAFTTSLPVKSCVFLSLKRIFNVVARRALDALRRHNIQEKGYKVIEMWECEWWRLYKTTKTVKKHIREHFPYRRSLAAEQLLEEIKEGKLVGHVQCIIELPEKLRANFANFPPIIRNTLVSKSDIGDLMSNYAEEKRLMSQPRRMLISSFTLQNWRLNAPLLLFYLQLALVCTKKYRFLSTLQRNSSTGLCSQQWTQEGKATKIPTQVSLQKQWSF